MKANVIVFEVATFIFFLVFYQGARRVLGRARNRSFLLGAAVFSLVIETVSVACGVQNYYWYNINHYYKTYPLGGYIIWLGVVPLAALLLFYLVSCTAYIAAQTLMPGSRQWARSCAAGAIAVGFYLMIEPVAVTNHWWTWNLRTFYFLDVPVLAWISVFVATAIYTWLYHHTIVEKKEPGPLTKLENQSIKRWPLKSKKITKNLTWAQLEAVFVYRLVFALAAFGVVIAPIMFLLWLAANRGQIPPGW